MGDVHIRQVVKYENYKRFGSKTRVTFNGEEVKEETAPTIQKK